MARRLAFDRILFAAVMLLVGLGLVMVYSASAVLARQRGLAVNPYFIKQTVAAVVGIGAMLLAMHIDYRQLRRPAVVYGLVVGVLILLVAVLFAPALNNTRRWFFIGGLSIQPSELAKLALIPFLAYQINKKRDRLNHWTVLIPCAFLTGLMVTLIYMGRDLGTAVLLMVPAFALVFLAGLSWHFLAIGGLVLMPVLIGTIMMTPYRLKRWTAFLDPDADPLGHGFQVLQSLIAVGSGGLFGRGPGNSLQKLHFLPSPHADFIFAIVAEELGFIGAMAIVGLFSVVLWRGLRAGLRAPDDFGRYLAFGFTSVLVVQAFIHVSVALGMLPTTGVPLPLISHGGSSLVTSLIACGVILNVSQHA